MNQIIVEDYRDVLQTVDLHPLRRKKVLVTGANGFLGQNVIQLLATANSDLNLNLKLYCTSFHKASKAIDDLVRARRVHFKNGDLISEARPGKTRLKTFLWNGIHFDYIFHTACYGQPSKFFADPLSTIDLNVNVTRILLELAHDYKGKFVFFSSADIYGTLPDGHKPVLESYSGSSSQLGLRAAYSESKRMGETLCYLFHQKFGTRAVILRILSLYGPGISINDTRVFGDFMRKALRGRTIHLRDEGASVKTYCYVKDALKMMFHGVIFGNEIVYNIGGRDVISVRRLAEIIGEYCGVAVLSPRRKSRLSYIGSDPNFLRVSTSSIRKDMSNFTFTPLREGLKRMIEWNKQEFL